MVFQKVRWYWIFLGVVVTALAFLKWQTRLRLQSVHVINLDRSQDRWTEIKELAQKARVSVQRWRAIDGTTLQEKDIRDLGVSTLIFRYTQEKKQPGVVGAFLSHRSLLNYLEQQPALSGDAHLILEDDAFLPPDFWEQWSALKSEIPADWDIVQFGVTYPNLKQMQGCKRIHTHQGSRGNVGAFAYLVRHGALPKINQHLSHMSDPIDVMIRNKQGVWNIYYVWPELCPHNDHGRSTIRGQN